jgi:pimeloyl-ACP methyl ester carboxylesterase
MMQEDPKKKFFGLWSVEDLVNIDLANHSTPEDNNNAANAVKGHNVTGRLHEIKNETLLICGEKDRIATLSVQKKIHEQINNSVFKVIKDARHGVSKEKTPEVNRTILNFLKN